MGGGVGASVVPKPPSEPRPPPLVRFAGQALKARRIGIIVAIVIEVRLIHPPVRVNLSVAQAQARDLKITSIHTRIPPFLIAPQIPIVPLFRFPQPGPMPPRALHG